MSQSKAVKKGRRKAKRVRTVSQTADTVRSLAFPYPYVMDDDKVASVQVPVERYKELVTAEAALHVASALQNELPDEFEPDEATVRRAKNRIVAARKARGLSQRELAAKLGVQQSHVSHIENNPHRVHVRTLKSVARALGVDVRTLI